MKEIDPIFNGRATKVELLNALKYLISKSQANNINSDVNQRMNQSSYSSHVS